MAVKLRIIGREDNGIHPEHAVEMLDLLAPVEDEIARVVRRPFPRDVGPVRLLPSALARDAMILEAGEFAQPVRLDVGLDVIKIEVVADVAIEIAVGGITRIALDG